MSRALRGPIPGGTRLSAVAAALLMAACGGEAPTDPKVEPIDGLPRALTTSEAALVDAGNSFAFGLFRAVAATKADSNIVLSPLSASMALGMALNGAEGETFEAMRTTLGFGELGRTAINESYHSLIELLVGLDPSVEMGIANSVWYRHDMAFNEAFLAELRDWFDARAEGLDFGDPGTVDRINAWVEEATNGRIEELLKSISPDEVMFLVNALYFKAPWVGRFDPDDTRDAPFHLVDGSQKTVRMMNRTGPLRRLHDHGITVVDLPYGGGAFSMTILLPDPDRSLAETVAGLDPATWNGWTAAFDSTEGGADLPLAMPRFKLEFGAPLKDPLTSLGMGIAFGGGADFSRISPGGLFITRVEQKAFIEVNEDGTEAAAATVVAFGVTSMPSTIAIDRPFAFVIREKFTGAILFIGQVTDPAPE